LGGRERDVVYGVLFGDVGDRLAEGEEDVDDEEDADGEED
jgi:hypothetical protein